MLLKPKKSYWLIPLAGLLLFSNSYAENSALDCDNPEIFVEKNICSNPKLSKMETDLQQELSTALEVSKVPEKLLNITQQAWQANRNTCKETACIEESYKRRIAEIKHYNVTDQTFIQHYLRVIDGKADTNLAVLEIHKLNEKRIRIIAHSLSPAHKKLKKPMIGFSGYANQAKHILVKDLDTQCKLKVRTLSNQKAESKKIDVRQLSPHCGNRYLRFSGQYEQLL
jgi:uncharacterized protein